MKMPWGKHKGVELEDIPTDYLEWCLRETNVADDKPALAEEMENQIRARSGEGIARGKAAS